MSSRFWASSEDLSVDSSAAGRDGSRDDARDTNSREGFESTDNLDQTGDVGALARIMTSDMSRPTLQPSQHTTFFYLALIEARCKKQAAVFINKQRRIADQLPEEHPEVCALAKTIFADVRKDLARVGMLPEEFVGQHIPELQSYLSSFDTAISNIATRKTSDISALPAISFVDTQSLSFVPGTSQLEQSQDYSNALVRQGLGMAGPDRRRNGDQSPFSLLQSGGSTSGTVSESRYDKDYQHGGFGSVYLAKYYLDNRSYAVKQIVVPAKKFLGAAGRAKLDQVLAEVRSLAQLDHHNIVRYYHTWVEERVRTSTTNADRDGFDSASSSDSDPRPDSVDPITQGVHSIQLGLERSLFKEIKRDRQRASSTAAEESRNFIVFESSESSKPAPGYKSAFRQPGEVDSDDEDSDGENNDSTEEIPRSDIPNEVTLYGGIEKDLVLHISMFPYPLSLDDFIWGSDAEMISGEASPRHCFHTLPTIRLLLAILDGTEYLHRRGFIHRDLKPPNIFLSILEPNEPERHHFINISDCNECGTRSQAVYLCPHIGDFGLIHDLKVVNQDPLATPSRKKAALEPFPFSTVASQLVGTKFYCPPKVPKERPICPKLDVYSFGVITFEMVYKFGTRTERQHVMNHLRNDHYPKHFEYHSLADGIKAMLCGDRDERWDCAQVRRWLNSKLKEECES
ncbi:kinase-like domain-containing protein [Cadophora sp. MPI-SDFR-AT-0126]|nr:kinase-like domain-containing protein [Leotiomycetes sp. MPI-SDFR-AT-0126]